MIEWVGNMIHWKLCKKARFSHTIKCTCTNRINSGEWDAEYSLGFRDSRSPLIPVRRPNLVTINKNVNQSYSRFCRLAAGWKWKKMKRETSTWISLWNMTVKVIPVLVEVICSLFQRPWKRASRIGCRGTIQDHRNIDEIGQNTQASWRPTVTHYHPDSSGRILTTGQKISQYIFI